MANYKCAMMALGIMHIIDGILLPSLWGLSWAFYGIVYIVGAPVWGGILFLIPAGIAGIIASSGENLRAVMVSKIFNSLASIAAIVIIVYSILTIWQNISFGGYGGAVATAVICVLLGILELIISIVAGVYSRNILINQAQSPVVVYGDGVAANPAMQYPGGQVQVQFAGPPPQGQYPGPQPQGQYSGPPPQGQYPGPQPQGQYPGPPPQGQYPGPPPQEVKEKY